MATEWTREWPRNEPRNGHGMATECPRNGHAMATEWPRNEEPHGNDDAHRGPGRLEAVQDTQRAPGHGARARPRSVRAPCERDAAGERLGDLASQARGED